MRRDLVLHVGVHRSGTTTLQEHVFSHLPAYLGRCRAQYGGYGHNVVTRELLRARKLLLTEDNGRPFRQWISQLRDQVAPNEKSVLLSDEGLCQGLTGLEPFMIPIRQAANEFWRSPPLLSFIERISREVGPEWRLRIILTIRNQSDYLASLYARRSDRMPGAGQEDFELQVNSILSGGQDWADWALWIEHLISAIGEENLCVLPLERITDSVYYQRLSEFLADSELMLPDGVFESVAVENARGKVGEHGTKRLAPLESSIKERLADAGLWHLDLDKWRGESVTLTHEIREVVKDAYAHPNRRLHELVDIDFSGLGY